MSTTGTTIRSQQEGGGFTETATYAQDSYQETTNSKGDIQTEIKVYFGSERSAEEAFAIVDKLHEMTAAKYGKRYTGYVETAEKPDAWTMSVEALHQLILKDRAFAASNEQAWHGFEEALRILGLLDAVQGETKANVSPDGLSARIEV